MKYLLIILLAMIIIVLYALHWRASIRIHSFLYHRGAAHNHYEFTSQKEQRKAYIKAMLILGPSYLSAWAYAVMHRMHHAYADTDKDPHRPYKGWYGAIKTSYLTAVRYDAINKRRDFIDIDGCQVKVEERFKKDIMDWPEFDRFFHSIFVRTLWILLYSFFYYHLLTFFCGPLWILPVMVLLHSIMAPLHGVIINYYAHKYGHREIETNDTSHNLPRLAQYILRLTGEMDHNRHHANPNNPDFSGNGTENLYLYMKNVLQDKRKAIKLKKPHIM